MSRIHQRLFRPRSSSVSSPRTLYTASPILPASTSRPAPPTSPVRLPIDLNLKPSSESHQQAPFSLALAPSSGPATTQPLLLSPLAAHHHHHVGPLPLHSTQKQLEHPGATHRQKRPRLKYHLDVGAYGIPKRTTTRIHRRALHTSPASSAAGEDLSLAVQVGEDAYFIRENAMGIADGVGGWSRSKHPASDILHPTPSALFAKRLMHHCAAELDVSPLPPVSTPPPVPWYWSDREPPESRSAAEALKHDLEDELEQLSEGIDVLQILERAYDQTLIKSHSHPAQTPKEADEMTGSSTALLAVLDHLPQHSDVASASADKETETKNYAAGSMSISFAGPSEDVGTGYDAAIRIVHVGDCMGMLVRDEDIVWRSEEMWWNYNTPVQLGPHTPHLPPSTTAHTCVLPVKKDDILILASDGLSDNLWDEDVLDEVVRFKRGFLGSELGAKATPEPGVKATLDTGDAVKRKTLAGMLSEALCSRARRVSERRESLPCHISPIREDGEADEVPFARRAREVGKRFSGGKKDDISVIVAVISPSKSLASQTPSSPVKTS